MENEQTNQYGCPILKRNHVYAILAGHHDYNEEVIAPLLGKILEEMADIIQDGKSFRIRGIGGFSVPVVDGKPRTRIHRSTMRHARALSQKAICRRLCEKNDTSGITEGEETFHMLYDALNQTIVYCLNQKQSINLGRLGTLHPGKRGARDCKWVLSTNLMLSPRASEFSDIHH